MSNSDAWYIVKQENGQCAVLPAAEVEGEQVEKANKSERWGPYASQKRRSPAALD